MEPVHENSNTAKLKELSNAEIKSNKWDPNIGSVENNSLLENHLSRRGSQVLKDIGGNEKISEGEKLKSMERKFPTILKVIVGMFTIGIGAAIMHKIEEKYSNEDLSARKEIANELAKLGHAIKQLENGNTDHVEIKFCDVEISVIKGECGKLSIKYGQEGFKVSKESLENNIAKNIDLLKKENASEFVDDSMLNVAKDIDQFKTKDAVKLKRVDEESDEEYEKRKEEYSEKEKRFKELANKILESSAGTKLEKFNAKNTSKEVICRVVKRVVTEKAKSEKEVKEKFNEVKEKSNEETFIGSKDARKIRENFEKTSAGEKSRVKIEKTEKKSSEKVENVPVDGINTVDKVDGNQEQNKITPQDVHNFVADIILNDDAFIHDHNVLKPGERLRQTLIKHSETISILLSNGKLLDTLDDSIKEPVDKALRLISVKVSVETAKSVLSGLLGLLGFGAQENQKPPESINDKLIKIFREMPANEFLEMEKEIDDAVENAANKMQDSLSEQLKRICNSGTNENPEVLEKIEEQISNLKDLYSEKTIKEFEKQNGVIPKKTREFLEKVFKEFGEISDQFTQSKNSEYIHDKLEKLISYMNDLSYGRNFKENDVTDESLIKDAKAIFFRYKTMLVEGEARKCTELSKR